MFNQIVSAFLSESCGSKCFRPLPPMLGNGQAVDLYKLYLVVRDKGGYEVVSENGMWGCVAKECGLSLEFGSCLKLVYVKYLDSIGEWMKRTVNGKDLKDKLGDSEEVHSVNVMDSESEKDGERVHLDLEESKVGDSEAVQSVRVKDFESNTRGFVFENSAKDEKDRERMHLDLEETKSNITSGEMLCEGSKVWRFADLDEAKRSVINMLFESSEEGELDESKCQNDEVQSSVQLHENERIENDKMIDDAKTCDVNFNNNRTEDVHNRKRKREGIPGILNWVANVAKDPCNPIIGSLPERSKWKYFGSDQRWKQILLVRQAMMVKRTASSSVEQSIWQKKQKMHPAMYEDHSVSARISRGLSFKKSQAQSCSETTYPGMQGDLDTFGRQNLRLAESISGLWIKNFNRKRVPVGEYFQAEVPEWDEKSCESDCKWLGTRVWPQEREVSCNSLIERACTGSGRHDSCGCEFQGSFECVRLHVSEKKIRLKLELGMAFYHWHIDKMGEEVAFSWNKVDEIKFEAIIKLNPPSEGKCFWEEIHKLFPYKKREQLVSYYFNVFLLRRRGQQNRSIPIDISSDDDDLEFETTTNCSGQRAVRSLKPNYCSPKKTHLNFTGNSKMG